MFAGIAGIAVIGRRCSLGFGRDKRSRSQARAPPPHRAQKQRALGTPAPAVHNLWWDCRRQVHLHPIARKNSALWGPRRLRSRICVGIGFGSGSGIGIGFGIGFGSPLGDPRVTQASPKGHAGATRASNGRSGFVCNKRRKRPGGGEKDRVIW